MPTIIGAKALENRKHWINRIKKLSGNFGADSTRLLDELKAELIAQGGDSLRNHLRLCGAIPEEYKHDSSEEKLYSKYTDVLASLAFLEIGIRSVVLVERGDAADVECFSDDYEFVADAKAFRLSRPRKMQRTSKSHQWRSGSTIVNMQWSSVLFTKSLQRRVRFTAKPLITMYAFFRSRTCRY